MRPRSERTLIRFYIFLTVICLAGLMQGGTTVWSSSSVTYVPTLENRSANPTVCVSYNSGALPLLNPNQFFLQTAFDKVAPQVLNDTDDSKSTSIVIFLADQANVSAAYNMTDQDARGWFVYNTLTKHAEQTQAGLQGLLKERGVKFQSYWAANMIITTADRTLVELVAARADVARIDSNKPARWIEDPEVASFSLAPKSPNTVEWGVANVNAPAVWALGFTGQGIVIGELDTGTRWTHAALMPKYRGWNGTSADHNYNWHDAIHSSVGNPCGNNSPFPCDDFGHGTHTAGTSVGDDGSGNQIGVAPGARWIACRNMDQGNGTPATYTECFQFTIAPTDLSGNNPNPALRPHVLNNSWTCPASEGCTTRAELETIVNNTEAAGIFVEASAGNGGPGCSTVAEPPAIYSAAFTTGAIDITNTLAAFSSRGPSTYYTPNLLKPNISAPGVSVRSSYVTSDSAYTTLSGTSMAGPHVVGVVALLWSARPQLLRNIAATKSILQNTANPDVILGSPQTCGGTPSTQIPNNSFGHGRVDALAAVNSVPTAAPANLSGTITDANGSALAGVALHLDGSLSRNTITDSNGNYHFSNLDSGQFYTVTPSLANYHFTPADRSFSLVGDRTDAAFTGTADATQTANAVDTTEYFVRQHYLDFFGREPDQGGFEYWSAQINVCNGDADCIRSRRIAVSASFFASLEFQYTGAYIYSLYAGALGRTLTFEEFMSDRAKVVGGPNLDANRAAFTDAFIERSEFTARYPQSMTRDEFVDAVLQTMTARSGVDTTALRYTFQSDYDSGGRARVLADVGEIGMFRDAEYNKAFVLFEYFGYLRRNPDPGGYDFWLDVLNGREAGNYRGMVCAFLTSSEYQTRFSSVVTHSNSECGR